MKRFFDVIVSLSLLPFLLVLYLMLSIIIKFESKGAVIFKQKRIGKDRVPFYIYKFRSMTVTESGDEFKQVIKDDPRVTTIGDFLRKTSLDETPQLINVLKGDMSLIGPRPFGVLHDNKFRALIINWDIRYNVLPGVTGMAQVEGNRGGESEEDFKCRSLLDNKYVEMQSMKVDLVIFIRTLFMFFTDKRSL